MEPAQYILTQDQLSTSGSFIICDTNARGFPLMYASQGFVDLFGYTAAECIGKPCGSLVAVQHDSDIRGLATALQMPYEEVSEGLNTLSQHTRQEIGWMMGNFEELVHVRVVNRKRSGDFFVCELVMLVYVHPRLGWGYAVGLQTDITAHVSVKDLLAVALAGEHVALHEIREGPVKDRFASLHMDGSTVKQYLAEKATEVWLAYVTTSMAKGLLAPASTASLGTSSTRLPSKASLGASSTRLPTAVSASGDDADEDGTWAAEVGLPEVPPALVGRWQSTWDAVEHVVEFGADNSIQGNTMGEVTHGTFEYDDTHDPHHLNLHARPVGDMPMPDPLLCIVKHEGDVLHVAWPYPGEARPDEFGGPGYKRMTRIRSPTPRSCDRMDAIVSPFPIFLNPARDEQGTSI